MVAVVTLRPGFALLAMAGHDRLAVLAGGPEDWAAATGRSLERGQ